MHTITSLITLHTKVGELLDVYPQLEAILIEMSPSFAKLQNPILRKTVARVATVQHAAVVANIDVAVLVNRLRKEVGQGEINTDTVNQQYLVSELPEWVLDAKITGRFDAIPVINEGGSPMVTIMQLVNNLSIDSILEVQTPFVPAPIIDMFTKQGFNVCALIKGNMVLNYFQKV